MKPIVIPSTPATQRGDRADDEARAEPVDELREHVLPGRGGAEPVRRGRRLTEREAELERIRVGEPRSHDCHHQEAARRR